MPHAAHDLEGSIELTGTAGLQVTAGDYRHTVVYFVPDKGPYRPRPVKATIYTHNRDFDPAWLAVPVGSTVTFTNLDQVTHNVFSVTPGASFDLGYQSAQQSETHQMDQAGMVLISCHVHRYMKGNILVVPSRYATVASSKGHFRLRHVPDVSGTLYFWNPRGMPGSQHITMPSSRIQQRLRITLPAVKSTIDLGNGA